MNVKDLLRPYDSSVSRMGTICRHAVAQLPLGPRDRTYALEASEKSLGSCGVAPIPKPIVKNLVWLV